MSKSRQGVTLKDFRHPYMQWGMRDESYYWEAYFNLKDRVPKGATPEEAQAIFGAGREILDQLYQDQELELDAPDNVPDGPYPFSIHHQFGHITKGYGLVITNGRFEPELTAHAVFISLAKHLGGRPNHQYNHIRNVRWDGRTFEILVGGPPDQGTGRNSKQPGPTQKEGDETKDDGG